MPSKKWFEQNPKVSAYLSQELNKHLKEFMVEREINATSEALTIILEEYFGFRPRRSNSLIDERLATLEIAIAELQRELREIQNSKPKVVQSSLQTELESKPKVVQGKPLQKSNGLLTTGEAYAETQRRGYTKSIGTFRRSLRNEAIPTELERLGLIADWSARSQANPKDNSVKWLKLR